jgi:hypothetical protein
MQDECLGCKLRTSAWSSAMDCSSSMRPLDLHLQLPCGCSFRSPALDSPASAARLAHHHVAATRPPLLIVYYSVDVRVGEKEQQAIPCGSYSSKTANQTFFHGKMALPGVTNVWNSFAPLKFKMHAWLSLRQRCWTVDRRRRRGLPTHIMCLLCGSQEETIDHLTLQCPYARAVRTGVVMRHKLSNIVPS